MAKAMALAMATVALAVEQGRNSNTNRLKMSPAAAAAEAMAMAAAKAVTVVGDVGSWRGAVEVAAEGTTHCSFTLLQFRSFFCASARARRCGPLRAQLLFE